MTLLSVFALLFEERLKEDRERLTGMVEEVLEKNASTRDDLLERVREAVAACNLDHE